MAKLPRWSSVIALPLFAFLDYVAWCVDFATAEWTALEPLPNALSDTVAMMFEGALYVVGGLDAAFTDAVVVCAMR